MSISLLYMKQWDSQKNIEEHLLTKKEYTYFIKQYQNK